MSQPEKAMDSLLEPLEQWFRGLIREEIAASNGHHEAVHLLNTKGAAERLCVPESKIRSMARKGELPSVHIGHYLRYKPEDLDEYIQDLKK